MTLFAGWRNVASLRQGQLGVPEQNLATQQPLEAQIQQRVDAGTRPISDRYQRQATVSQQRHQPGAATLVELAQARTSQVQAASAEVSARYAVAFWRALMSYSTGELDPAHATLGA